ncbi:MAG: hypothetical protein M3135_05700, partial [Actinomycetota bacterium]|nr:hypothetical protein [Actinomycetota bacterium]
AKVGWNAPTRRGVENEADALEAFPRGDLPLAAPALLHRGAWQDLTLLVTAPLPGRARRYRPLDRVPDVEITRAVSGLGTVSRGPLVDSAYVRALGERVANEASLQGLLAGVLERAGDLVLEYGAWHGDWVPWNLARHRGRLHVLDWEHWGREVPLGFDVVHFMFQVAFVARGRPLEESFATARRDAPALLERLGAPSGAADAILRLYFAEITLRAHRAALEGAFSNPRFYPRALSLAAEPLSSTPRG